MRTIWNGSLSFGLVNIPIGLARAPSPKARASDVSFRLLHRECQTPIQQKRWCPVHDREVGPDEIVKGWEVSKGEFVVVEEADLEAIEQDSTSRAIDITGFVPEDTVDPVYFDRTYFLVPAAAVAARRPYVLLQQAMSETGMAALGRFVLAGKEKLCLIRARGDGLALETMYLAEDVYSQAEIDEAVAEADVKDAEVTLARQIIDSLVTEFRPAEQLTSEYRQDLRALLEAKLKGHEPVRPEEPEEEAPMIDLMEALRRSVEEAQKRKEPAAKAAKATGTRRRSARVCQLDELPVDAESLRDPCRESLDAEPFGRVVAGRDEVDCELARGHHRRLGRLARDQRVIALASRLGQMPRRAAGHDRDVLDSGGPFGEHERLAADRAGDARDQVVDGEPAREGATDTDRRERPVDLEPDL